MSDDGVWVYQAVLYIGVSGKDQLLYIGSGGIYGGIHHNFIITTLDFSFISYSHCARTYRPLQ